MEAILSTKIGPFVIGSIGLLKDSVYYWTDSQNVSWWIRKRSRILKTFVANRVANIQEVSDSSQWRYVSTKENPADLATRELKMNELIAGALWCEGPVFLHAEVDN